MNISFEKMVLQTETPVLQITKNNLAIAREFICRRRLHIFAIIIYLRLVTLNCPPDYADSTKTA